MPYALVFLTIFIFAPVAYEVARIIRRRRRNR